MLPGSLTVSLQQQLACLGSWIPFPKLPGIAYNLLGVSLSEPTARRCTEGHGSAYEAVQNATVAQIERELPEPPQGPAKLLMSVDGAMISLVGGEWVEVKTMVLGEITEPVQEKGESVVHSTALSYFSRLTDSDTFQLLALGETHRRGVETAQQVVAATDGAVWIQNFVDYHRLDAARVLDFGHAAEYVAVIGGGVGETESAAYQAWLKNSLHILKHSGFSALLPELQAQVAAHPQRPEFADALAYLEKRAAFMNYPEFQARGWPIGSGSVESANKLVVEARLKGAGMHWARTHVNPMLSLRNAVCNDRWDEAWVEILKHHRQQRQLRYRARAQRHAPSPLPPPLPKPVLVEKSAPKESDASLPKPPWRPAPNHPWKRSPSCSPSLYSSAKL